MDEELKEKDFIENESSKSPNPFLLGIFFIAILMIILSGLQTLYREQITSFHKNNPFFEVTNREFALFLMQNPGFATTNVSTQKAYLTPSDFIEQIDPENQTADQLAHVPADLLFRYHTWNRLIGTIVYPRTIPAEEFKKFIEIYGEWMPNYWKGAPKAYRKVIQELMEGTGPQNLATLSEDRFPDEVRQAFIGWKNFSIEREEIEKFHPTFKQLNEFIDKHPKFSRNYWINIVKDSVPGYLSQFSFDHPDPESLVPLSEVTPFLELAIFNYMKAKDSTLQNHAT